MRKKMDRFLMFAVLVLAALACTTVTGGEASVPQANPPVETQVSPPTYTPAPTYFTLEPVDSAPETTQDELVDYTPELSNVGDHRYTVAKTEGTCPLTLGATDQTRNITFNNSQAFISNLAGDGGDTYDSIGDHRYSRINDAGQPIVVVFSPEGFLLQVYNAGDDVELVSPCSFFTFTLND